MIGKLIGAAVGAKAAEKTREIGGPTGAALGILATSVISRMSIPAMLTLGAAGYLGKKFMDRNEAEKKSATVTDVPTSRAKAA